MLSILLSYILLHWTLNKNLHYVRCQVATTVLCPWHIKWWDFLFPPLQYEVQSMMKRWMPSLSRTMEKSRWTNAVKMCFLYAFAPSASNLHRRLSHVCYWQWNNQTRSASSKLTCDGAARDPHALGERKGLRRCCSAKLWIKRGSPMKLCRYVATAVPLHTLKGGFFFAVVSTSCPRWSTKTRTRGWVLLGLVAQCCMLHQAEQNKDTFTHSRLSCRCHF